MSVPSGGERTPGVFTVELITPEREVYNGPSSRLSVPGVMGSLGILANHAPLLTELRIGEASLTDPNGDQLHFYIGGGFLEVNRNRVTILAEDAASENEMAPAEAERLHQIAQDNLALADGSIDAEEAAREAERAAARLRVARRGR